jgi:hypothetical protein
MRRSRVETEQRQDKEKGASSGSVSRIGTCGLTCRTGVSSISMPSRHSCRAPMASRPTRVTKMHRQIRGKGASVTLARTGWAGSFGLFFVQTPHTPIRPWHDPMGQMHPFGSPLQRTNRPLHPVLTPPSPMIPYLLLNYPNCCHCRCLTHMFLI